MNNQDPPIIWHSGHKPTDYAATVRDCAFNVRMSRREKNLLLYYARCGNGFHTALADITNKTGIAANKVSTVRAGIARRGLIYYGEGRIVLLWQRIRRFASMPERLSKHDALHGTFFPDTGKRPPTLARLASRIADEDSYRPVFATEVQRPLTDAESRFVRYLGRMCEDEYELLLSIWRNENGNFKGEP